MKSITFDLHETTYRQPLTLTLAKDGAGKYTWHLRKEPADQRDDSVLISGITDETLLAMADAVRQRRQLGF